MLSGPVYSPLFMMVCLKAASFSRLVSSVNGNTGCVISGLWIAVAFVGMLD